MFQLSILKLHVLSDVLDGHHKKNILTNSTTKYRRTIIHLEKPASTLLSKVEMRLHATNVSLLKQTPLLDFSKNYHMLLEEWRTSRTNQSMNCFADAVSSDQWGNNWSELIVFWFLSKFLATNPNLLFFPLFFPSSHDRFLNCHGYLPLFYMYISGIYSL